MPPHINGVEDSSKKVQNKNFNQWLLVMGACFNHWTEQQLKTCLSCSCPLKMMQQFFKYSLAQRAETISISLMSWLESVFHFVPVNILVIYKVFLLWTSKEQLKSEYTIASSRGRDVNNSYNPNSLLKYHVKGQKNSSSYLTCVNDTHIHKLFVCPKFYAQVWLDSLII